MTRSATTGRPALRGFLNIDKPAGLSSFDVVRAVRRAAGIRRVGHAGTLDPAATGVLPIALGEATRLVEEVLDARKRYHTVIEFGVETDTDDGDGEVVGRGDASSVSHEQVEAELAPFRGEQWQRPPAYSAVKRGGVPAYRAARAGAPLDLEERPVVTYAVDLVGFERGEGRGPLATVEVECGRGLLRALPGARPRSDPRLRRLPSGAEAALGRALPRGGVRTARVRGGATPGGGRGDAPARPRRGSDRLASAHRRRGGGRGAAGWARHPRTAPVAASSRGPGTEGALLRARRVPRGAPGGDRDSRCLAPLPRACGRPREAGATPEPAARWA